MSHKSSLITLQAEILTSPEGLPEFEPFPSIFLTKSKFFVTFPKTTCLPLSQEVSAVVMKN
jgi:hypothetical protein